MSDHDDILGMVAAFAQPRGPSHVSMNANIRVTEKRAPTDDSMRLLQEMEKKVTDRIVASYVINDNVVTGAVLVTSLQASAFEYRHRIAFKLNGRDFHAKVETHAFPDSQQEAANELYEAVAKAVTELLFDAGVQEGTIRLPKTP